MSLSKEAKAIRVNRFIPDNIRQVVFPNAAGIGAVLVPGGALTWGVWVDVAVIADIVTDTLVTGISLDTVVPLEVLTIDIGSCAGFANAAALNAGGAPAIAAAHRAVARISVITLVGQQGYIPLDSPVFIPNGVGIVARAYSVAGGGVVSVTAHCVQLFI